MTMRKYLTKVNLGFVYLVIAMFSSIWIGFWAYAVAIPVLYLLGPRIWNDMKEMAEHYAALMGVDHDKKD